MLQRLHFEARSLVSCIYTHHGVERAQGQKLRLGVVHQRHMTGAQPLRDASQLPWSRDHALPAIVHGMFNTVTGATVGSPSRVTNGWGA
jgi:hypothetical protein